MGEAVTNQYSVELVSVFLPRRWPNRKGEEAGVGICWAGARASVTERLRRYVSKLDGLYIHFRSSREHFCLKC